MTTANKPAAKNRYELWQDTIAGALTDARWHEYDCDVQRAATEFNRHLADTQGYSAFDWRMIKAMIWTESGGPTHREWRSNPMQIGNPGDPGLQALLSAKEGGELIMPPDLMKKLTVANAGSAPQMNIRAGMAYLLMRLARFDVGTVQDKSDNKMYSVVVKAGDSLDKIARVNGTTVDNLKMHNASTGVLRAGKALRYQKAQIRKMIVGWESITTMRIAARYNVGDPNYAKKLDYCMSMIRGRKASDMVCAQ